MESWSVTDLHFANLKKQTKKKPEPQEQIPVTVTKVLGYYLSTVAPSRVIET